MGILATCVSFAFFQMNQFESLHLDIYGGWFLGWFLGGWWLPLGVGD